MAILITLLVLLGLAICGSMCAESLDPGIGISGQGTTLSGDTTGPIGMLTKIGFGGWTIDKIDVTTMNAPGKWKVFIAGMKEAKDWQMDLIYEGSNTAVLLNYIKQTTITPEVWTVTLPTGSTFSQTGYISNLGQTIPMGNDKVSQTVTITVSGPPKFTDNSGD